MSIKEVDLNQPFLLIVLCKAGGSNKDVCKMHFTFKAQIWVT